MGKQINISELKSIQLNLLSSVHDLCIKENLRYYMCGGTLLGAVRHKGYIPWDDDIDIAMPRPDFERLIELYKEGKIDFKLCCTETESKYGYVFAKAWDNNTEIFENSTNRGGVEIGVNIDIFPVDGLGDTLEEARKSFRSVRFLNELLVAANWGKFVRSESRSILYEPIRFAFFLLSRFVNPGKLAAKMNKKYQKHSFEESKYIATYVGVYRDKEIFQKEEFTSYVLLPFEGREFFAPKGYETYLSKIYGDYMTLPPEEARKPHHIFTAFYKD